MTEHPDRGWSALGHSHADAVMRRVGLKFKGLRPAKAHRLARRLIDGAIAKYRRDPNVPKIACRGQHCFGCCLHQKDVDTSPFEVERILNQVETDGRLANVVARAQRLVDHGKGGVCPLLSPEGRCTVYKIRPLTCGAYHSLDRQACHSGAHAKIPHAEMLWIETCMVAGFGLLGFDEISGTGRKPRYRLFEMLARLGRARLEAKEAA